MCGELRVSREDMRQFVLGAAVGGGGSGSSTGSGRAGGRSSVSAEPSSLSSESSASSCKTAGNKRKADGLSRDDNVGPDDSRAVTKKPVTTGWKDLPSELVRRIGKLQTDAQSLAGMERTCKSWLRVVVEGNDDPDVTSKKPSLWRDMVLGWNPTIASVAEALMDSPTWTTSQGVGVSGFSWKGLLQTHWVASRKIRNPAPYQPHTQLTDYIFTVEFRSEDEFLFATSGRGLRTPKLWNQNVAFDAHRGVIEGDLDPEIGKRLGDNPFNADQLKNMTARVLVTKVSDMSMVELTRVHIDAENVSFFGIYGISFESWRSSCVPKTRLVTDEEKVYYDKYDGRAVVNSHSLRLQLTLESKTGEVSLQFVLEGRDDIDFLSPLETLIYLEVQCPWPKRNKSEKKCV